MLYFVNKINNGQKDISANSFYFDNEKYNEKPDLEEFSKNLIESKFFQNNRGRCDQ